MEFLETMLAPTVSVRYNNLPIFEKNMGINSEGFFCQVSRTSSEFLLPGNSRPQQELVCQVFPYLHSLYGKYTIFQIICTRKIRVNIIFFTENHINTVQCKSSFRNHYQRRELH